MIYCNARRAVDDLKAKLDQEQFSVECIRGDMTQDERNRIMKEFRSRNLPRSNFHRLAFKWYRCSAGIRGNQLRFAEQYRELYSPHRSGVVGSVEKELRSTY